VNRKFPKETKDIWTLKDTIEATAVYGNRVYLVDAVSGKKFTYEESNHISNKIANGFINIGLQKNGRIGLFMKNKPEYIFTLFAIGKIGLIEVPINLNLREHEITHIVNNAQISTIVVDSNSDLLQVLLKVAEATPVLDKIIIIGDMSIVPEIPVKIISFDDMVSKSTDKNPEIRINSSDDFCIFFTSGTTGLPKGALISHKTFILAAKSACAVPGIDKYSRNYTPLPLFHANAQLYSMTTMRLLGATLILSDRFSPKKFWKEIMENNATYFNSIGGIMQILNAAFEPEDVPNHTAKFVFVGGTPADLWESFERKFKVDIFEGYSMSEVPIIFGNIHPDKKERKIGSFGKPLFLDLGRKTTIVNNDNKELKVGTGELLQAGENFCTKTYWNSPEANEEAFDQKGWFHSGDLVRVDENGYHYFIDRKKFMIRIAGENVSAFEVEAVINSYPDIVQSAVIPVPDPLRGEEIKAFVKLKEGIEILDYTEFIKFCAQKLAYFKVPRYIEITKDFPKTATERIKKVEMKNIEKERMNHGWDRNIKMPNWK